MAKGRLNNGRENDPLWYKDAIIYELHVKSFYDSNADGIGDFKGLTMKLDYLQSLGITALWLLPFYPSPLKDDGYDISSFYDIHPNYGNMKDFKDFLREAHRRGIKVITELVLNHTSDQHIWFQRARKSGPESKWRDYYVWSDTPEKYQDARIIFKDFESSNWSWDPVAKAYFWHRFYAHQPDLNFDNPTVQKAMLRIVDYWLAMGVDGLRLDAVPYLFERDGTNCENLPETYVFLKKLRSHIDSKYKDRMLLAEANQWPEDARAYFGEGDLCHMSFHFPLMPRIFMASWMEDRFPITDIMEQTPQLPENCQWALFLRNHDELTLEMVTDEERDYMYRIYASDPVTRINLGIRRRLAPLLENHRKKIELMNVLLFSLPGTPVLYYGDEIGMGDNYYLGDRNGVRTPMQWSADLNAGFSSANPQRLYLPVIIDPAYHYETINASNQDRNRGSLLWWMKWIISTRKLHKAFGRGTVEFLSPDNMKVLAFIRNYGGESILIIVNLSRFSQVAELDLSRFAGCFPEEIFSRNRFPLIKEAPYVVTMGAYDYFIFLLKKEAEAVELNGEVTPPKIAVAGKWGRVFNERLREILEKEDIFIPYLKKKRWFGGKGRKIREIKIGESFPLSDGTGVAHLLLLTVRYTEGEPETYLLPLSFAPKEQEDKIKAEDPYSIIAYLKSGEVEGVLFDAVSDERFRKYLLWMVLKKQGIRFQQGRLSTQQGSIIKDLKGKEEALSKSQIVRGEQSNTSILYGTDLFLKLYRRISEGINPDPEIIRFLSETAGFKHVPPFAGTIEYKRPQGEPVVVALIQGFVPNRGDAMAFSLDSLSGYFERALSRGEDHRNIPLYPSLLESASAEIPQIFYELAGGIYLDMISRLGAITGEMHLNLASGTEIQEFAPEPYSLLYQRSLYQSMQSLTKRTFYLLRRNLNRLPEAARKDAELLMLREKDVISRFASLLNRKISAKKIRIHGDYHLGQVLYTGNDFIVIDFEGEPARPLSERRLKRSPLKDVAGMIRSFHYAAYSALFKLVPVRPEDVKGLEPWADIWYRYIGGVFLKSYLSTVKGSNLLPQDKEELEALLRAFILEKAVYELGYELNNRPDWVGIPIKGIQHLLES